MTTKTTDVYLNNAYATVRGMAKNLAALNGHSDYTRFVLLGRSRIGSNFVLKTLNEHPHVHTCGEVFRPNNDKARHVDGERYLKTNVFHRYPQTIEAVGLKLFYYHAQDDAQQATVWPYLQADTRVKVLHMKRRNILQTHLSRKLAGMTAQWIKTKTKNVNAVQTAAIYLDYEECRQVFEQTRGWEEQYDAYFASHDLLEVVYEDVAEDFEAWARRILRFLNVSDSQLRPFTKKQAKRPLSESISNYFELKEQFAGTRWADFFQE